MTATIFEQAKAKGYANSSSEVSFTIREPLRIQLNLIDSVTGLSVREMSLRDVLSPSEQNDGNWNLRIVPSNAIKTITFKEEGSEIGSVF